MILSGTAWVWPGALFTRSDFGVCIKLHHIMRARVTATDSNGNPSSSEFVVTYDGERREFDVASTGTIRGSDAVIEHMISSDGYAVAAFGDDDDVDDDDESSVTGGGDPTEDEQDSDSSDSSDRSDTDDTDTGDL
jgi:hypothetical protein